MSKDNLRTLELATQNIRISLEKNDISLVENFISVGDSLATEELENTKECLEYIEIKSNYFTLIKEYDTSSILLNQAINICKSIGTSLTEAKLMLKMADINILNSDYENAYSNYKKCYDLFEENNDIAGIIRSTNKLGYICIIKSEYDKGIIYLKKSMEFMNLDDTDSIYKIDILQNLGSAYYHKGELDLALEYYNRCLKDAKIDNVSIIAKLLGQIGDIHNARGDVHQALKYYTDSLEIHRDLGNNRNIGLSLINVANIYEKIGELNLAYDTLLEALELFEEERDVHHMAISFSKIGNVLYKKGELIRSLEYLTDSLRIQEELGVKNTGETYNLIGEIFYNQKNFEKAIYYQNRSVAAYLAINNNVTIIQPYFSLIMISIALNDEGLQHSFFEIVSKIYKNNNTNLMIKIHYQMAKALVLKSTGRRIKMGQAEMIFDEIMSSRLVDHKLLILASQQKCDMLLDELKTTNHEKDIIEEIEQINERLKVIGQNQNSYIIQVETMLLESIISLLRGDLEHTENLFFQAHNIAEMKNLKFLTEKVKIKKELFELNYDEWKKLSELKVRIRDKLRFKTVSNFLETSQKTLFDPFATSVNEVPKLLLIINEAGLLFFSLKFSEKDEEINEHLIAAFLSAINSFSKDAFLASGSLNQIKHQDYTIAMLPYKNLLFYYTYENISNNASLKLQQFVDYFVNNVPDFEKTISDTIIASIGLSQSQVDEIKDIFCD